MIQQIGRLAAKFDPGQDIATRRMLGEERYGASISELIRSADLGIQDLSLRDFETRLRRPVLIQSLREAVDDDPFGGSTVVSIHQRFDSDGKPNGKVEFDSDTEWSAGTRQLFRQAGPFLKSLKQGKVLIVDEMDAQPASTTSLKPATT